MLKSLVLSLPVPDPIILGGSEVKAPFQTFAKFSLKLSAAGDHPKAITCLHALAFDFRKAGLRQLLAPIWVGQGKLCRGKVPLGNELKSWKDVSALQAPPSCETWTILKTWYKFSAVAVAVVWLELAVNSFCNV